MNKFIKKLAGLSETWTSIPSPAVSSLVALWFIVSFSATIINKSVLSEQDIEPEILTFSQTACTTVLGWFSVRGSGLSLFSSGRTGVQNLSVFVRLGLLRFATVVLGLTSLKHVAASFTETVKAAGPIFTVTAAFLLTGERTSWKALLTLLLVMGGLMLASATELSFTKIGFFAAVAANMVDSVQNVFSKTLLQAKTDPLAIGYSPMQLQYLSAVAAFIVQSPFLFWQIAGGQVVLPSGADFSALILVGVTFFVQSTLVFSLISHFSPVTVSVLNTVKRAIIIYLSSLYFGNIITPLSGTGMFVTVVGGYLYGWVMSRAPILHQATKDDVMYPCDSTTEITLPDLGFDKEAVTGMRHQKIGNNEIVANSAMFLNGLSPHPMNTF